MVELAVFGASLLVVLAVLVRLSMTLQFRQMLQQEAFRKALALSRDVNAEGFDNDQASYTIVEDRRIPDPSAPLVESVRFPVVAQNQVLWGTDLFSRSAGEGSPVIFEINCKANTPAGCRKEFTSNDFSEDSGENGGDANGNTGSGDDEPKLGLSADMLRLANRSVALGKTEDHAGITTTRAFVDHDIADTTDDGVAVTGQGEVIARKIKTKSSTVPVVTSFPTPQEVTSVTWTTSHE